VAASRGKLESIATAPRRFVRNTSIATRLALVVLLVTLGSLLATTLVALDTGEDLADGIADSRLIAARSSKAAEVAIYLNRLERGTAALARSPMSRDAVRQLSAAHRELEKISPSGQGTERRSLRAFYRSDVIPPLERMRGSTVAIRDLLPTNSAAVHLQHHYLASSPASDGREASIDDAGDGSRWTTVHRRVHPSFRRIASELGAEDLYLIDSRRTIVYSREKGIELGTNLSIGPSSGTTLARLADRALFPGGNDEGGVTFADFAPFVGAADAPVGFVAAPIIDRDQVIGAVALRFAPAGLSEILTAGGDWDSQGLGETGEVVLVGSDGRLRSEARGFVEDRDAYLDAEQEAGSLDDADRRQIEESGTSVYFSRVADTTNIESADLPTRRFAARDAAGTPISVVGQPITAEGIDWFLLALIEIDEIDEPITGFVSDLIVGSAVFAIVLVFFAVVWASRLVDPIRIISRRLRKAHGVETTGELELPEHGAREFTALAANFDSMLSTLSEREAAVEAAHDKRRDFLERFLPTSVARRVDEGDRQVIDQVPNVTIVVLVFRGLTDVMERPNARELIDRAIDEADRIAAVHGLERLKLTANAYVAACGVTQPYLDQVPRSVAFAVDVIEAWHEIVEGRRSAAAGVHTGAVTVGLAGANRLVYDAWGPDIVTAQRLAQRARPGEVVVSSATRERLPAEIAVSPVGPEGDARAWVVTSDAEVGAG
jgi:class 3 adenylate cyclase